MGALRGARCIGPRECGFKKRGLGLMAGTHVSIRLKMPPMERREAGTPAQGVRRRKALTDGCALRRSIPSGLPEGNGE